MVETVVLIENEGGLHARPINMIVQIVSDHNCEVLIGKQMNALVDAASMLSLMTLGAIKGTELIIQVDGDDKETCLKKLSDLVSSKFGES